MYKNLYFRFLLLLPFLGLSTILSAQKTSYSDSITVNFFLLDECRICQYYGPLLGELYDNYHSDEINFAGYFPNFSSKRAQIAEFKASNKIPFELKTDYYKKRSKKYNLEVLPSVVIYDEIAEKVLYTGRIDNRFYGVGRQRQVTSSHDLVEALDAIVNKQTISNNSTQAVGCFINFADEISREH
jgi:thiol-disulfide isomerase/thioredoxin